MGASPAIRNAHAGRSFAAARGSAASLADCRGDRRRGRSASSISLGDLASISAEAHVEAAAVSAPRLLGTAVSAAVAAETREIAREMTQEILTGGTGRSSAEAQGGAS